MKNRTLMVMLAGIFLLILHPSVILAHSSLVSTVPNEKSTSEVTEITMNFNETLDTSAKIAVTNAAGEEQALKDTKIKGKVVTAVLEKPLSNGSYKVDWRIISADRHPGKGSFAFVVEVPATATTAAPTASATNPPASPSESSPVESPVSSASPSAADPSSEAPTADTASDAYGGMVFSTWALIGAAVILVAAVTIAFRKRK
ncbi:copper resistance CopC family protein [Cohnella candidum]|uniref:Copper resistance protein CopC n=1 Tax=Cohnella candidum TaxID=2674991 RepID=A0A3G3JYK0_9BACL|nr:copper resistance protein CopC [Cohnella candidum]AYQ73330.1 copper resistance protein CopC [Cohnella candidum]